MTKLKRFVNSLFGSSGVLYVKDTGEFIPYSSSKELKQIVADIPESYKIYRLATVRLLDDNIMFVLILFLFLSIFVVLLIP